MWRPRWRRSSGRSSARSSTWWPTGCRARSPCCTPARAARSARRRSSPTTTCPCSGGCGCAGSCRACGATISWHYPAVEAVSGLLCALCVLKFGADSDVWLPLVFVLLLIPITLIDLEFTIIPNSLTLIGAVAAIVLTAAFDSDHLVAHLIAGVAAGGFFLIAAIVYPAGHGDGRRQARRRHGPRARPRRGARDLRRAVARHDRRRGRDGPLRRAPRAARRASRSARGWPRAASSGCSSATRSSTGTWTTSRTRGHWGRGPTRLKTAPGVPIPGT